MKILCIKHKDSAVFDYRMTSPLIEGLGAKTRTCLLRKNDKCTIGELAKRFKKIADIWVIKYIEDRHTLDVLYTMRNHVGSKIVVDIDDNIWQIPFGNIARGTEKQYANRAIMMTESVKVADWVTVSTEPLKQLLLPLNEKVVVLPNYIDPKDWKFKRKKHDKVRIGWVYSQTHTPDIEVAREALEKIVKKYDVEVVVFGTDHDIFSFPTTNIPPVVFTEYPKTFMEEGIDISIAPLLDNEFNRAKSNIKWLESSLAGAAFIGSNVYPYQTIKQGKTGYTASGDNQWEKYLSILIENKEKREELVKNAKEEVLRDYSKGDKWLNFYKCL